MPENIFNNPASLEKNMEPVDNFGRAAKNRFLEAYPGQYNI